MPTLQLHSIINVYKEWVDDPTYLCFSRSEISPNRESYITKYHYHKTAKRGNDVYIHRLKSRLAAIEKNIPDIYGLTLQQHRYQDSVRCFLITLTYRRDNNVLRSWYRVGSDFNRFLSALKSRYGAISHFRVWESHKDGFPHIHLLIVFHQHGFKCFRWRTHLRIIDKKTLGDLWPHGFIDIQGVYNFKKSFNYLKKYLIKDIDADTKLLTIALCWKTKRQTFGISKKWHKRLDKANMPNSNQTTLRGENFDVLVLFMGVFHRDDIKDWYIIEGKPPKIPEKNFVGSWSEI